MGRSLGKLLFFMRFMPSFTAPIFSLRRRHFAPLPDQTGKTWLVTGATGGIGRAISLEAARLGATVIAIGRNEDALKHLAEGDSTDGRLIPLKADLALLADIDQLMNRLEQDGHSIDVLVNNVGVLLHHVEITAEGHEKTLATNLLGHYHLTEILKTHERLEIGARVINMSSGGMYNVPLMLPILTQPPGDESTYDGMLNYAVQKRAQVVLTDYWREHDSSRLYYVMHPGWVDTVGVQTALPDFRKLLKSILRTPEMGADTALWLGCTAPEQIDDGIWFDRKLRSAHIYKHTKTTRADGELLAATLSEPIAETRKSMVSNVTSTNADPVSS